MKAPKIPLEQIKTTGAYGGVPSRIFPSTVFSVFAPVNDSGMPGIGARLAARPPSAPVLDNSNFHSNVPGARMIKGMPVSTFNRGSSIAVDNAVHLTGPTHATLRRKILRGL